MCLSGWLVQSRVYSHTSSAVRPAPFSVILSSFKSYKKPISLSTCDLCPSEAPLAPPTPSTTALSFPRQRHYHNYALEESRAAGLDQSLWSTPRSPSDPVWSQTWVLCVCINECMKDDVLAVQCVRSCPWPVCVVVTFQSVEWMTHCPFKKQTPAPASGPGWLN